MNRFKVSKSLMAVIGFLVMSSSLGWADPDCDSLTGDAAKSCVAEKAKINARKERCSKLLNGIGDNGWLASMCENSESSFEAVGKCVGKITDNRENRTNLIQKCVSGDSTDTSRCDSMISDLKTAAKDRTKACSSARLSSFSESASESCIDRAKACLNEADDETESFSSFSEKYGSNSDSTSFDFAQKKCPVTTSSDYNEQFDKFTKQLDESNEAVQKATEEKAKADMSLQEQMSQIEAKTYELLQQQKVSDLKNRSDLQSAALKLKQKSDELNLQISAQQERMLQFDLQKQNELLLNNDKIRSLAVAYRKCFEDAVKAGPSNKVSSSSTLIGLLGAKKKEQKTKIGVCREEFYNSRKLANNALDQKLKAIESTRVIEEGKLANMRKQLEYLITEAANTTGIKNEEQQINAEATKQNQDQIKKQVSRISSQFSQNEQSYNQKIALAKQQGARAQNMINMLGTKPKSGTTETPSEAISAASYYEDLLSEFKTSVCCSDAVMYKNPACEEKTSNAPTSSPVRASH